MAERVRLQVALAQLGFASRRVAAEMVKAGRVKVNAKLILEPGERVDAEKDTITVDGKIGRRQNKVYLLLHKPKGVVTTVRDKYARQGVLDLIKQKDERIYPVGRLDKDTTGLLLLTNDGELTYRLTHPKFGIKKVYQVCVQGEICPGELNRLQSGILLEDKKTFPCKIKIVACSGKISKLEVELKEGRKRQIKKMFAYVGHPVLSIERIGFGSLQLRDLKVGQWRRLKVQEIADLKRLAEVI